MSPLCFSETTCMPFLRYNWRLKQHTWNQTIGINGKSTAKGWNNGVWRACSQEWKRIRSRTTCMSYGSSIHCAQRYSDRSTSRTSQCFFIPMLRPPVDQRSLPSSHRSHRWAMKRTRSHSSGSAWRKWSRCTSARTWHTRAGILVSASWWLRAQSVWHYSLSFYIWYGDTTIWILNSVRQTQALQEHVKLTHSWDSKLKAFALLDDSWVKNFAWFVRECRCCTIEVHA